MNTANTNATANESERTKVPCPACHGRGQVSFHKSFRTFGGGRGVSRSRTVLTCDVCAGTGRIIPRPPPLPAEYVPNEIGK
jgi:DnaJ-class molecular chaperone